MPRFYELSCRFDSRKSFYGKAMVETLDNGDQVLYSYNTEVASIRGGKFETTYAATYSQTTRRHVREFARQNGFDW